MIGFGAAQIEGHLFLETTPSDKYKGYARYRAEAGGFVIGHTKPDKTAEINQFLSMPTGVSAESIPAEFVLRKYDTGGWAAANIYASGTDKKRL
ncbi:MAG: hypothetical protein FWH32_03505 [Clostridiales bacterium]|nr:hypothetical protein [Clostridiales bacterium]